MASRRRAWLAAAAVPALGAAGFAAVTAGPPALAGAAGVPYAVCLALGPGLAFALLRRAGVAGPPACAAALALPGLWLAKELFRVSGVFGPAETLYYALNPVSVGIFGFAALQMALVEIAVGRLRRGRWRPTRGPAATLAALAVLGALFAWLGAESGGREIFYAYIALYRWLFPG